jgi:hypothetical protein
MYFYYLFDISFACFLLIKNTINIFDMEANIKKFQLSDADFIILNHKGARIVKLVLSGMTIISAE